MKKITQYLILLSLILLINPVFGFPGMKGNTTTQTNLNNTTESDQDIMLIQHLIEVDAVQFKNGNKLAVRETIIFKNQGTANFFGTLRTWVPDRSENITIARNNMMDGSFQYAVTPIQNENIIGWQDMIESKSLPPLYYMEYVVPAGDSGTVTQQFKKILLFPTLTKQPKSLILKVTRNQGESVSIKDEKGLSVSESGSPREEGNSILYGWDTPEFKEFTIEFSKSTISPIQAQVQGSRSYIVYIVIGILIILVLLYPFISKKIKGEGEKSEKKSKQPKVTEKKEIPKEREANIEIPKFKGKSKEMLLNMKAEITSKLDELEKEYKSGNLLDEEYEDLKKSYSNTIKEISSKIDKYQ